MKSLHLRTVYHPGVRVDIRLVYRLVPLNRFTVACIEANRQERLPWSWKITVGPIFPSVIVLSLTAERPVSAFITIQGDDLQIPVLRESGQNNCSFKSRNFSFLTIILPNIPLSQNVDRYARFVNTFSMF